VFLETHKTSVFSAQISFQLADPTRLKALFRRCKLHQIFRKKPTVGTASSNSDSLVDMTVTVYLIHTGYAKMSNTHSEQLWFNAGNTDTNFWARIQWFDGQ